jgi:hypothetical protein
MPVNKIYDPTLDIVQEPQVQAGANDLLYQLQLISAAVIGGGGGGDATAANQVIEIARLTSILSKIIANPATDSLQVVGNMSLNNIDNWTSLALATLQDIDRNAHVAGATNLFDVVAAINSIAPTPGGATSALQTTGNTSLSSILANLNVLINASSVGGSTNLANILSAIGSSNFYLGVISVISGFQNTQSSYTTATTQVINTLLGNGVANKMTVFIPANAGAVGNIDIQVKMTGATFSTRVPLKDRISLTGAMANPPFVLSNPTQPAMYELDLTGVNTVTIIPSIPSSSFGYFISKSY